MKSIYQFAMQVVAEKSELPRNCDPFITLANDARKRIREIAPREMAKLKQSPVIIDVRENDEFAEGHISGARNVSRGVLERKIRNVVSALSAILLYCSCGNRSALAADNLQKMGYQNVYSLKGGLSAWLEAGGVVETRRTPGSSREDCEI